MHGGGAGGTAGPGGLGPSQLATVVGLSVFFPDVLAPTETAVRAAAYANTIWLLQFGQAVALGLIFLFSGHVSLDGLFEPPERFEQAGKPEPVLPPGG